MATARLYLRVLLLGLVAGQASAQQRPATEEAADRSGNVIEEFDIAKDGDDIIIPVTVWGKTWPFLLDTGSSGTVYDESFRLRLGKPVQTATMQTATGLRSIDMFQAPAASLRNIPIDTPGRCTCIDLRDFWRATSHDFYGVVGMDFLKQFIVSVDFDHGKLRFLRAVEKHPGESMRMRFGGNTGPYVIANVCDRETALFLLDTGMSGNGCIESEVFASLLRHRKVELRPTETIVSGSGTSNSRVGSVQSVSVGGVIHHDLGFKERSINALGMGYLSRFAITFDFPMKQVYFRKGKHFADPDPVDLTGLRVARAGAQKVVHRIINGSSAAIAGVQKNDVLLQVDGIDVVQQSLFETRQLLSRKRSDVRIRIMRGTREFELLIDIDDNHIPRRSDAQPINTIFHDGISDPPNVNATGADFRTDGRIPTSGCMINSVTFDRTLVRSLAKA